MGYSDTNNEVEATLDEFLCDLYDSLNVRLYENVKENLPRLNLDAVSLQDRIFLRFNPIVSAPKFGTDMLNIENSISYIENQVSSMTKLITQIHAIRSAVSQSDNLDYYCDPDSFSLGLIQVVPTFLQQYEISQLNRIQEEDLDKVNSGALSKIGNCESLTKLAIISADVAGNGRKAIHLNKILEVEEEKVEEVENV